jgi:hypothetical protein
VTVRFLETSEIELDQAVHWYEAQAPGLGNAFLIEVLSAVDRVERFPEAWHPLSERTQPVSIRTDLHHRQPRHPGAGDRAFASPAGLLARSTKGMILVALFRSAARANSGHIAA